MLLRKRINSMNSQDLMLILNKKLKAKEKQIKKSKNKRLEEKINMSNCLKNKKCNKFQKNKKQMNSINLMTWMKKLMSTKKTTKKYEIVF